MEGGVLQALDCRLGIGILDHDLADIEANHIHLWMSEGHFLRPSTGSTGHIQHPSDTRKIIKFSKMSVQIFCDNMILIVKPSHFGSVFSIEIIDIVFLLHAKLLALEFVTLSSISATLLTGSYCSTA